MDSDSKHLKEDAQKHQTRRTHTVYSNASKQEDLCTHAESRSLDCSESNTQEDGITKSILKVSEDIELKIPRSSFTSAAVPVTREPCGAIKARKTRNDNSEDQMGIKNKDLPDFNDSLHGKQSEDTRGINFSCITCLGRTPTCLDDILQNSPMSDMFETNTIGAERAKEYLSTLLEVHKIMLQATLLRLSELRYAATKHDTVRNAMHSDNNNLVGSDVRPVVTKFMIGDATNPTHALSPDEEAVAIDDAIMPYSSQGFRSSDDED